MASTRIVLSIVLVATLGLACAHLAVEPSAHYKVTERFRDLLPGFKVLGVEVTSALPEGRISDADLKKLSSFFTVDLRQVRYLPVVNLTSGGNESLADMILTVNIDLLKAATRAERKSGIPSQLRGTIFLRSRTTDRKMGSAAIWAEGSSLDLESNNVPSTVRSFTMAIADIVK